MTMPCVVPEQPLLLGWWHVHTTIGLDLLAGTGGIVSCLFLVGACSGFYSLGWALINCQSFSGVLLGVFARANRVCTHRGSVAVADELHMIFECPALQAVRQRYAPLFSTDTNTVRSFFAQQDHMQVFKFVLDCLDVFHI